MADETVYPGQPEERSGFCQDCGRPLTATTVRKVGSAIFCGPCLEVRMGGAPNTTSAAGGTGTGPIPGAGPVPGAGPIPGAAPGGWNSYPPPEGVFPPMDGSTPHPTLAGFLGLIPGVGAMYNGQFAKGIVHLLVFVVLVALKDSVSDIIGLVVAVWVIYMVIDAYQTAKARRYGYPLPDPFGLNNVGERLGIKNWVAGPPRPAGAPAWTPGQPGPYGAAATQPAPDWVGYVPPTNYATMPGAAVPPDMPVPPPPVAAYAEVPYAAPTAGYVYPGYTQPYAPVAPVATAVPVVPVVPQKRFPTAALWLLVLGAMFLPGTLNHEWRFSFRWMLPTFLAGLSVWTTLRRIGMLGGLRAANLICSLRTPALLMTLAVLFALQDWQFLTLGQTWPVFFIVLGGMLLLERTAGKTTVYGHPPPVADSMDADPGRWTATGDATTSDASKGGQ